MALTLPFNYNPSSVSVKTSQYTIPANTYAFVVPNCVTSDFKIDTIVQVPRMEISVSESSASATGVVFTALYPCVISLMGSGAAVSIYYGGNATNIYTIPTGTLVNNISLAIGDQVHVNIFANYSVSGRYLSNESGAVYKVPSGTVLDGDRFTVIEYSLT